MYVSKELAVPAAPSQKAIAVSAARSLILCYSDGGPNQQDAEC